MTTPQDPFRPPDEQASGAGAQPAPSPAQPTAEWQQTPSLPYGSSPYGSQPYGSVGPRRNGLGTAALVLGILALVTSLSVFGGILLGLIAIVLGAVGRGRAKRGEADNGGMALAGIVLGAIGLLLSLAFIAAGVAIFQSEGGQQLIDCLEQAAGDAAAEQACQQQFADELGQ